MAQDPTDPLALGARAGLPDALRVLVDGLPRAGWTAHPEFNDLTRFWLERHLMFRDLQARLEVETRAVLDRGRDPRRAAGQIARIANLYLNELHGHHQIEDAHYFPVLRRQDARLEAGFDLLDADHHALHAGLAALAEAANGALRGLAATPADLAPAGRLLVTLEGFGRLVDRHLEDEEDLIVPVILAYRGGGVS